jgi:hypothetical protein
MSNQFAPYQDQPPPFLQQPQQQSSSGCLWGLLIGCGGVGLVCALLCVGGVWYVKQNAGKWVAGMAREVIVAVIEESEIADEEKAEVIAQVDRVVNAYKQGRISEQDLERLMQEFQSSPAFMMISAWGLEKAYLDPSGLSDEEKEAGRRSIQRAFRGLVEKKITQEQFARVMPQDNSDVRMDVAATTDGGKAVVKNSERPGQALTDEEVRKLLADLKKLADDAEIPDEPFEIDISDEVKKAVDQAGVP